MCLDVFMEWELGWHGKSLAMAALPSVVLRSRNPGLGRKWSITQMGGQRE